MHQHGVAVCENRAKNLRGLAREQLRDARVVGTKTKRLKALRALFSCALVAGFVASTAVTDAQTGRRDKDSAFKVALQPFSLVRDAVHAVGDPIVDTAPRAVARVATAPVRVAAFAARALPDSDRLARAESLDEEEPVEEVYAPQVQNARAARAARPVGYGEPLRVAYVTAQPVRRAEPAPQSRPFDDEDEFARSAPRDEQAHATEDDEQTDYPPEPETQWPGDRPTVSGSRAVLRNGIAYAPSRAPENVKNAIWAVNALRRKPYRWGGGHASFHDRGYDCSGAVSYALHYAGALSSPMPSTGFLNYGRRGRGRWITIYSRPGHTFAVIAGLRLDTTDFQRGGNTGPRWHIDGRNTDDFVARHPAGL